RRRPAGFDATADPAAADARIADPGLPAPAAGAGRRWPEAEQVAGGAAGGYRRSLAGAARRLAFPRPAGAGTAHWWAAGARPGAGAGALPASAAAKHRSTRQ